MQSATMTWLHNGNYGTILQAYALQQIIIGLGHENIVIDYAPSTLMKTINLFTSGNDLSLFMSKWGALKDRLSSKWASAKGTPSSIMGGVKSREQLIDEFRVKYIKTTRSFGTPFALKALKGKYDVYICGSDQIWNPTLLNPPYMFSYLGEYDKRVSYAPSFGVEEIENKKVHRIKKLLTRFKHISVRESHGLGVLRQLGIDTRNCPVVLDPTLLLPIEKWNELIENRQEENYLLCFFLHSNQHYWESAQRIAKMRGLKIVVCPYCADAATQPYDLRWGVGPIEWLTLIRNASYVLTDSFHCVIFSLLFHKSFVVWERFKNDSNNSQNSRITHLLGRLNLNNRIVPIDNNAPDVLEDIDSFEYIGSYIAEEREKSLDYLKRAIES